MGFFADIDDELTQRLCRDYEAIFQSIRELTTLLEVDSYAEMGDQHEHADRLLSSEAALAAELRHELAEALPEPPDPEVIRTFLLAYRLEALYPETVGPFSETVTTIPLETLPRFQVRQLDPAKREAVFHELVKRFAVTESEVADIESAVAKAETKLARRRRFTDAMRERLLDATGAPLSREEIKGWFDRWFPQNPLRASEVEMVITRTCVYWCIPRRADLEPRETEAEQTEAEGWLKLTGRFAFQYFSHFPTFSSFDARDAERALVDEFVGALGWSESEVIEALNSTTTIERTGEIEKYLIHDTWGHTWQGDLTCLARLYDTMESLKAPVDVSDHLTLPDENVVCLLDLIYLKMDGTIRFDAELAERYIDEWIRLRMEALLAPLVAELTADCVEYKFKLDHQADRDLLPSSSLFSENPAKLDFAWVDLSYFVRTLRRDIDAYHKDENLEASLVDRVSLLLKRKYPRQFRKVASEEALRSEIESTVGTFLSQFRERRELHLNQALLTGNDEVPKANAFALLFTNFLRVQCTLNHLIENKMEKERPELADQFNVLILFVVLYFQSDPLRRFWSLDEVLGEYGLAFLSEISGAEGG